MLLRDLACFSPGFISTLISSTASAMSPFYLMQILLSLEQLSFPLPPFCGAHGFGHNKGETKRVKLSSLPLSCATGFFFFFFFFFSP